MGLFKLIFQTFVGSSFVNSAVYREVGPWLLWGSLPSGPEEHGTTLCHESLEEK